MNMINCSSVFRPNHFLTTLFLTGLTSPLSFAASNEKPNIIIILADDLGWSNIGCFGGMIETPNLDQLAETGIRFSQFYSAARCCPSRASLLTGLSPHESGIGHMTFKRTGNKPSVISERMQMPYSYRGWLGDAVPTLPEMLKTAGYRTYMSGKWHVGSGDTCTWPKQRGFDCFYGFLEGTSNYFNPNDLHRDNRLVKPEGERYYTTDAFTSEAIHYLTKHEAARDKEPFFLYLAYNAPHFPMQAMPEDFQKYRGHFTEGWDVLREKIIARQKEMGLIPENTVLSPRPGESNRLGSKGGSVPAWNTLSPAQQDSMDAIMATFAGMVDRMDRNIGKLIAHLRETNELDNTLIFFLSDNGAEAESPVFGTFQLKNLGQYGKGGQNYGRAWATFSNTPFREYKHFTHQGGVQTPLIVHWPDGIKADMQNKIVEQYGFLPDIVETCLDVASAVRPKAIKGKPVPESDGHSLKDVLQGKDKPIHNRPICCEHEGNRMVRGGQWKLVSFFSSPWELYNVEADRSETNNLAGKYPEVVQQLSQAFDEWASRVGSLPWTEAKDYSVYPPGKYNF
ncbi:MAG: arylsulfatase [Prolixibacteraceae bacterium]|jgi:arylsulfatase|nr:arylsulfatase [Prolixibacteraceae bacterium]